MGRTTPSVGRPPAAFRKQQRAKRAKETLTKTIPAILASNERARNGVIAAELTSGPDHKNASVSSGALASSNGKKSKGKGRSIDEEATTGGPETTNTHDEPHAPATAGRPNIRISVTDTLTAAAALARPAGPGAHPKKASRAPNVAILNMASLLRPGGGFTSGATSQEEFLCMRTTLLPSLREEFYRLPEVGSVWSPDVLVFRDSTPEARELPAQDRFFVDVVTAGMMRFPNVITRTTYRDEGGAVTDELKADQVYASAADAALVRSKMKAVMAALNRKGCKKVVLGAWGCGAYGNPVGEISRAWKEILLGTGGPGYGRTSGLTEVVFAISQSKMASEFARAWGEGIEVEDIASDRADGSQEEGDESDSESDDGHPSQTELDDLQAKIEQIQIQVSNAKTPMLRDGLESVLKKLRHEVDVRVGQSTTDSVSLEGG